MYTKLKKKYLVKSEFYVILCQYYLKKKIDGQNNPSNQGLRIPITNLTLNTSERKNKEKLEILFVKPYAPNHMPVSKDNARKNGSTYNGS